MRDKPADKSDKDKKTPTKICQRCLSLFHKLELWPKECHENFMDQQMLVCSLIKLLGEELLYQNFCWPNSHSGLLMQGNGSQFLLISQPQNNSNWRNCTKWDIPEKLAVTQVQISMMTANLSFISTQKTKLHTKNPRHTVADWQ